ncbi:hypothetical protein JCM9492_13670 [Aquifex pyrophilus]
MSGSLSHLIAEVEKQPKKLREKAESFIPFMLLQMEDEDLDRLDREYSRKEAIYLMMAMLLFPKERWTELGIPDYLMKYEIAGEEEEEEGY